MENVELSCVISVGIVISGYFVFLFILTWQSIKFLKEDVKLLREKNDQLRDEITKIKYGIK